MKFWDFLNWLYEKWTLVTEWFGDRYYDLKHAAENAWTWAKTWGEWALAKARDSIENVRLTVEASLRYAWDWLYTSISGVYTYISARMAEVLSSLGQSLYLASQAIRLWVEALIAQVLARINQTLTTAQTGLRNWIETRLSDLRNLINPVLALVNHVSSILHLTTVTVFNALIDVAVNLYKTVYDLVHDPKTFLASRLRIFFITFLCHILARGLGTQDALLPNEPDWKNIYDDD